MHATLSLLRQTDFPPLYRKEHRRQGRQIAHHALADEFFQVRHFAGIQQRGDDFPIGGVPADEQDFMGQRCGHGRGEPECCSVGLICGRSGAFAAIRTLWERRPAAIWDVAARHRSHGSSGHSGDQAAKASSARAFFRARQARKPAAPRPSRVRAGVEGSGTCWAPVSAMWIGVLAVSL